MWSFFYLVFFLYKKMVFFLPNNDNFYEEKYNFFLNKYQIKKGLHKMFLLFEFILFYFLKKK